MKHTHLIESDSAEEFKAEVAALHNLLSPAKASPIAEEVKPAAPRGPGRPPKTPAPEKEIATEEKVDEAAADDNLMGDDDSAPVTYTFPEVKQKFQAAITKLGVPKAKKILDKFKVAQAKDLTEDQYSEFVAALETAK